MWLKWVSPNGLVFKGLELVWPWCLSSAFIISNSLQTNTKSQEVFEQVLGLVKLVECTHMKNKDV